MDPATVIGLLLAFGSLIVMVLLEGGSLSSLLLPAPMILVFGATLAIGLAGNTLKDVIQAFKAVPGMFIGKTAKPQDSIDQMVRFAEKARSEGLLSLEEEAASVNDPFLARALQNIADGTDAEDLRMQMEDEIDTKSRSDHSSVEVLRVPRRLRPHRRHRRHRRVPDPRPGKPVPAGRAGAHDRRRVRRHPLGPAVRQLHLAAVQLPPGPAVRTGHRTPDAADGRHARRAGRRPAAAARRAAPLHGSRAPAQELPEAAARRRPATPKRWTPPREWPPSPPQETRRAPRRRTLDGVLHGHGHGAHVPVHRPLRHVHRGREQVREAPQFPRHRLWRGRERNSGHGRGHGGPAGIRGQNLEAFAAHAVGKMHGGTRRPRSGPEGSGPAAGPRGADEGRPGGRRAQRKRRIPDRPARTDGETGRLPDLLRTGPAGTDRAGLPGPENHLARSSARRPWRSWSKATPPTA